MAARCQMASTCTDMVAKKSHKWIKRRNYSIELHQELRKLWFDPWKMQTLPPKQKDTKATHTLSRSHTFYSLGRSTGSKTQTDVPDFDQDVTVFSSKWFEREKRRRGSKLKFLISVRHLNTTDIRKKAPSLLTSILHQYWSTNQITTSSIACHTCWGCDKTWAQVLTLPVSLTSEHLITSLILWWVQMGVPTGTGADRRAASIGWLWLSGRWSSVIILSLGGDMLTS